MHVRILPYQVLILQIFAVCFDSSFCTENVPTFKYAFANSYAWQTSIPQGPALSSPSAQRESNTRIINPIGGFGHPQLTVRLSDEQQHLPNEYLITPSSGDSSFNVNGNQIYDGSHIRFNDFQNQQIFQQQERDEIKKPQQIFPHEICKYPNICNTPSQISLDNSNYAVPLSQLPVTAVNYNVMLKQQEETLRELLQNFQHKQMQLLQNFLTQYEQQKNYVLPSTYQVQQMHPLHLLHPTKTINYMEEQNNIKSERGNTRNNLATNGHFRSGQETPSLYSIPNQQMLVPNRQSVSASNTPGTFKTIGYYKMPIAIAGASIFTDRNQQQPADGVFANTFSLTNV